MADEERQGGDGSDDALDELGSLLSGAGEASDEDAPDADSLDLGALALSSRPLATRAEPESDADDESARRLLAPVAEVRAPTPAPAPAPEPRVERVESQHQSADLEPEGEARRGTAVWVALLVGFAAGLGSGALLFRSTPADEPAAAVATGDDSPSTPSAANTVMPSHAPVAAVEPAQVAANTPAPAPISPAGAVLPAAAPAVAPAPSVTASARPPSGASPRPAAATGTAGSAPVAAPTATATSPASGTLTITPAAPADSDDPGERTLAAAFDAPAKSAPVPVGEERDMDDMLDQALANPEARRQQQALGSGDLLPPTPSREQVNEAMAVLLPAIRGCAMGQAGLATAGIVVANDGKVASVSVSGAPFAGAASGRCMEGVIRKARFPRFNQPTFRVKFPFAIK